MDADATDAGAAVISRASASGPWSGPRSIERLEQLDRLDRRDTAERRERLQAALDAEDRLERRDRLSRLDALDALIPAQELLTELAERHGQPHLAAGWIAESDADKARLLRQIGQLEASVTGGLRSYIERGARLLKASREGLNPLEGYVPSVGAGHQLELGSPEFSAYESAGLEAIGKTAFVIVAGGLGERLGYSGIKLALPSEMLSGRCYLELYIRHILALGALAGGDAAAEGLPLVIMTSDDTHDATAALLDEHGNWGLPAHQLRLIKQQKVPCFSDGSAALALEPKDRFKLLTKPHGHGDVHALLHSSGIGAELLERGFSHLVFFQDTNALVFNGLLAALGVSVRHSLVLNSICVPRRAGDASGALLCLSHKTGKQLLCNVEYSELDALLKATTGKGDVSGADGLSPYPGNTNQLVVALAPYVQVLKETGGAVPEFVNPKYKDDTKTAFKSPTRLECMMQDLPWLLPADAPVSFTSLDAALFYAPVKNALADGAAKASAGVSPACASVGETAVYSFNAKLLAISGAELSPAVPTTVAGVPLELGPRVVLTPAFRPSISAALTKLRGSSISLSARSSLVLDGNAIAIQQLQLDGALVIRAVPGARVTVKRLAVRNQGLPLRQLSAAELQSGDVAEVLKLRGYCFEAGEQRELIFEQPGDYVIDE